MSKYILILAMCTFPAIAQITNALPNEVTQNIHSAELVGKGRLRFLSWDIYDASLYAPKGKYAQNKPFALSLDYLRNISGKEISDRSIEEMRFEGFDNEVTLAAWHEQMRQIFPDVISGTRLTGIYTAKGETLFFKDGKKIGSFREPEFGRYFFNIWLSSKTTHPDLRQQLLENR